MKNPYLYSALVAAVSISIAQADEKPPAGGGEKCYGVAKAGENDCHGTTSAGERQGCPGWSEKDNDPYAWSWTPKGECLKKGGSYQPPPQSKLKSE